MPDSRSPAFSQPPTNQQSPDDPCDFFGLVYAELRRIASSLMAREWRSGVMLQTTALVHEAYLRLFQGKPPAAASEAEFFASAATAMRRILVEHARERQSIKGGGRAVRVAAEPVTLAAPEAGDPLDLLSLDEALERLEGLNRRQHDIVMLRYFAGQTVEATARYLNCSGKTVENDWKSARAWLLATMEGRHAPRER